LPATPINRRLAHAIALALLVVAIGLNYWNPLGFCW
jgi:hypothetical protein